MNVYLLNIYICVCNQNYRCMIFDKVLNKVSYIESNKVFKFIFLYSYISVSLWIIGYYLRVIYLI